MFRAAQKLTLPLECGKQWLRSELPGFKFVPAPNAVFVSVSPTWLHISVKRFYKLLCHMLLRADNTKFERGAEVIEVLADEEEQSVMETRYTLTIS